MLKATESIFFWSPDQQFCLHQVSSYLLFWLPKILESSSPAPYLHLLFLCPMRPPPSPLTSINLGQISEEIFQKAGRVWHSGPFLTAPSSLPLLLCPSWWNTTHPSSLYCVLSPFITAEGSEWTSCVRDSGPHLMRLFTIRKRALKRENRSDSSSERPDCGAILLLGLWHPPHLFLARGRALRRWRGPLSWVSFRLTPQRRPQWWDLFPQRVLWYMNSSVFFDQGRPGHPVPWLVFLDD